MWEKIKAGTAADLDTVNNILSLDINNPHSNFPSSERRAIKPEPPPIYTHQDVINPAVRAYYDLPPL